MPMSARDERQIVLSALGHRFGKGPWLFRGLDATLLPDRIYALVGPSGSGKSTLLSLLAGWEAPAEGTMGSAGISKTTWVFQNPHGIAKRTALDHVAMPLLARGFDPAAADQEALDLLAVFGLADVAHQIYASLSGGESQRLLLARAIASDPDLLLIDEPTAQLDTRTSHDVNAAVRSLRRPGTIVVIATHDEETRDSCTDVIDLVRFQA